jgi:hypothetical protein
MKKTARISRKPDDKAALAALRIFFFATQVQFKISIYGFVQISRAIRIYNYISPDILLCEQYIQNVVSNLFFQRTYFLVYYYVYMNKYVMIGFPNYA